MIRAIAWRSSRLRESFCCEADEYYRSALFGMQQLPLGAAVGIGCARRGLSRHWADRRPSWRKRLGRSRHRWQEPEGGGCNFGSNSRPSRSHDAPHRICPESQWPLDSAGPWEGRPSESAFRVPSESGCSRAAEGVRVGRLGALSSRPWINPKSLVRSVKRFSDKDAGQIKNLEPSF